MSDQYSPSSVPIAGLAEAAAAGVNLALEDQTLSSSSGPDIGTTVGMYPTDPFPIDG